MCGFWMGGCRPGLRLGCRLRLGRFGEMRRGLRLGWMLGLFGILGRFKGRLQLVGKFWMPGRLGGFRGRCRSLGLGCGLDICRGRLACRLRSWLSTEN